MKLLLKTSLILFVLTCIFSCTNTKKIDLTKEKTNLDDAKSELKSALLKNEILPDKVISDSQTAIEVAESILFKIYGKENIMSQKPYDVSFIDEYYVINGTLPKQMTGGTFLMIISAKNGKIIKLTHGK